jgi:hypothetical protein
MCDANAEASDGVVGALIQHDRVLLYLDTLHTLLINALEDPTRRSIRCSNAALVKRFDGNLDIDSAAIRYLHEVGFRHAVGDFEARRVFPAAPSTDQIDRLRRGAAVLGERIAALRARWATNDKGTKGESALEAQRTEQALLRIRDDRANVRLRTERERLARQRASDNSSLIA